MCLIESRSHAVDSEWQGRQEAQSLPGWAVGDVLSSMPRCPPGSLRSVQLPLDHLVEKRDRAVCHRRSNGRRSHVPVTTIGYQVTYKTMLRFVTGSWMQGWSRAKLENSPLSMRSKEEPGWGLQGTLRTGLSLMSPIFCFPQHLVV